MLVDMMTQKPITNQWFPDTWKRIAERLSAEQMQAVIDGIAEEIIGTHSEVTVPCFKAEADWHGKPWDTLFWEAARQNFELAAKMFGLMAVEAFKQDDRLERYYQQASSNPHRRSDLVAGCADWQ